MATILCVDDEAPVGVVLENALAGMGHEALLATSVDEAMKTVFKHLQNGTRTWSRLRESSKGPFP